MNRILVIATSLLMCSTSTFAQLSATEVLDKTAAKFSDNKAIEAHFLVEKFSANASQGFASGTIKLKGRKFNIDTRGYQSWFDGKTQWTYSKADKEVNISTPTEEELQSINPYAFVNMYKVGYKASSTDAKLRGQECYEVRLIAMGPKNMQEVLLTISKSDFTPLCIRYRQGAQDWTRIVVDNFTNNAKIKDTSFVFDKKLYPGVEIIDLR